MMYEIFFLVDGTKDHIGVERRAEAGCLNRGLQLGVEFPETIQEEYGPEFVVINWADSDNAPVKHIHFISGLTQWNAWAETKLQGLLHKHDLSMNTKVLMTLAKG